MAALGADGYISFNVVIISQCMGIAGDQTVHLKYIQIFIFKYSSLFCLKGAERPAAWYG